MGPENCSTIAPVALQTMDSKYFQPVKNTLNTWGLQGTQVATYKNFQKLRKVDCARPFSNFALFLGKSFTVPTPGQRLQVTGGANLSEPMRLRDLRYPGPSSRKPGSATRGSASVFSLLTEVRTMLHHETKAFFLVLCRVLKWNITYTHINSLNSKNWRFGFLFPSLWKRFQMFIFK